MAIRNLHIKSHIVVNIHTISIFTVELLESRNHLADVIFHSGAIAGNCLTGETFVPAYQSKSIKVSKYW